MLSGAQIAAVYDRIGGLQDTQAFYEDPALAVLLRYGDFGKVRSVYEAGCGTGRVARRLLRDVLSRDCLYVGADLSPRMVELAREKVLPWPAASIVREDITSFRPDLRVDRVLSLFVIDLMPDAEIAAFLTCAYRVLAQDGLLCIGGLAEGECGFARVVSNLWKRVHDAAPAIVGGCRPGSVARHLESSQWRVLQVRRQSSYGVTSEAVVAAKV